jgi:hypothetical protein
MVVYSVDHMTQYTPWANVIFFYNVETGHKCSNHCAYGAHSPNLFTYISWGPKKATRAIVFDRCCHFVLPHVQFNFLWDGVI